jgi:hypothetical protein
MTELSDAEIREICAEVSPARADDLLALFLALSDEEEQVLHQMRPHRIIRRISDHIDEYLGA